MNKNAKTAKNIQVGDMIALMHDFQRNADGKAWLRDENDNFVPDTTSPLEPVFHGNASFIATYKTIVDKSVVKQGNRKVTIITCEDGSTYELNATYAFMMKPANC
jgi:hypothetical protein